MIMCGSANAQVDYSLDTWPLLAECIERGDIDCISTLISEYTHSFLELIGEHFDEFCTMDNAWLVFESMLEKDITTTTLIYEKPNEFLALLNKLVNESPEFWKMDNAKYALCMVVREDHEAAIQLISEHLPDFWEMDGVHNVLCELIITTDQPVNSLINTNPEKFWGLENACYVLGCLTDKDPQLAKELINEHAHKFWRMHNAYSVLFALLVRDYDWAIKLIDKHTYGFWGMNNVSDFFYCAVDRERYELVEKLITQYPSEFSRIEGAAFILNELIKIGLDNFVAKFIRENPTVITVRLIDELSAFLAKDAGEHEHSALQKVQKSIDEARSKLA